jgi:formylglycine-generating enzyme required for sulfatase activity
VLLLVVASVWVVSIARSQDRAQVSVSIDPAMLVTEREGMVLVPAGEFIMGSSDADSWAEQNEMPQRVIRVPAFLIDQLEVTNMQYKRFVDATGWPPPPKWVDATYADGADFIPVAEITWWDAMGYAKWAGKRLPSEVEWEKAARGTDGRRFPWGDKFSPDFANNEITLLPVGSKPQGASPYGVIDMAGNVAEWTASVYRPYPALDAVLPVEFGGTEDSTATADVMRMTAKDHPRVVVVSNDPRLAVLSRSILEDNRQRVYRGGSFNNYARFLRCANRQKDDPGVRWDNIGFRCAADVGSKDADAP